MCTIVKHALTVFHLQIAHVPLQRLVGEIHRIYKIEAGKPDYHHYDSKSKTKSSGVWHARKVLTHLGFHNNNHLTSRVCKGVGVGKVV